MFLYSNYCIDADVAPGKSSAPNVCAATDVLSRWAVAVQETFPPPVLLFDGDFGTFSKTQFLYVCGVVFVQHSSPVFADFDLSKPYCKSIFDNPVASTQLPFVLSKNMNYKYYIILSSITVLLVHLFVDFNLIINHLSDFANNLNLPIIANRLDNFNQVVFYDSTGGDFYKRTNLYLKSFNAFCHSPIWGNLFSKS